MVNIAIIDNYDSFTYNLVSLIHSTTGKQPAVFLNNHVDIEQLGSFDRLVLSPGPGLPSEAGLLLNIIHHYASSKPILGVCLGHQAIGEAFGASLVNLPQVFHGVATPVFSISNDILFKEITSPFEVGRYHSWVIDPASLPEEIQVTAVDEHNNIMGLSHKTVNIKGVQFHPESIMTPMGKKIIENWLSL